LALSSKRSELRRALELVHFARSAYLELDLDGVPGAAQVSLFAWPEPLGRPTRIGIDVVRLEDRVLSRPVTLGFDLAPHEQPDSHGDAEVIVAAEELQIDLDETRPELLRFGGAEWRLCAQAGIQREVRDLNSQGRPIFQEVDTEVYCYKLICPKCGRARYAKRNSVHQIKYCRVCTRAARLRKRALDQFQQRNVGPSKRKRLPPHEVDRAIALFRTERYTISALAREMGVTPSAMSKLLKRRKAKP
jgi:hypothetical protein